MVSCMMYQELLNEKFPVCVTPTQECHDRSDAYLEYSQVVELPNGNIVNNKTDLQLFFKQNPSYLGMNYLLVPEVNIKNRTLVLKMLPIPETA